MRQHGVEYGQKLMYTSCQSDFFDFACGQEPCIKGFDPRVVARRHEGAHRQNRAHVRTAAPYHAPAAERPTVTSERCHTHQRRALLAWERPQLGACQQQRPGTHGANPRGTRPQVIVFPPPWARPAPPLEGLVQPGEAVVEPRDRCLQIRLEAPVRPRQAVLLRGAPDDPWLAAPSKGTQLLRLGVRQRPGRRAHHVGKMRQRARLQRIGLGPWSGGTRKSARLPRVHNDDGQARRGSGAGHQACQATRSVPHHKGGMEDLAAVHTRRHAAGIVGNGPALPGGAQGHITLGFRHINAHTTWDRTHAELLSARPCTYGLSGTRQLYGLGESRT